MGILIAFIVCYDRLSGRQAVRTVMVHVLTGEQKEQR
jgi:hypothetical protein